MRTLQTNYLFICILAQSWPFIETLETSEKHHNYNKKKIGSKVCFKYYILKAFWRYVSEIIICVQLKLKIKLSGVNVKILYYTRCSKTATKQQDLQSIIFSS